MRCCPQFMLLLLDLKSDMLMTEIGEWDNQRWMTMNEHVDVSCNPSAPTCWAILKWTFRAPSSWWETANSKSTQVEVYSTVKKCFHLTSVKAHALPSAASSIFWCPVISHNAKACFDGVYVSCFPRWSLYCHKQMLMSGLHCTWKA